MPDFKKFFLKSYLPMVAIAVSAVGVFVVVQSSQQRQETRSRAAIVAGSCPKLPRYELGESVKHQQENNELKTAILDTKTREMFKINRSQSKMRADQAQKLNENIINLAKERKSFLGETMRIDPDKAFRSILSDREKQTLSAVTKDCVEQEAVIEGELEVIHADNFEKNASDTTLTLITEKKERIVLHPANEKESKLTEPLISGKRIRVKGQRIDDDLLFDVSNEDSLTNISTSGDKVLGIASDAAGVQQTVVLMVNFQNTPQPSLTKAQVDDVIFNQLNNYYRETSYNKTSISGQSLDWYTLPIAQNCNYYDVRAEAIKAADAQVNFTNYSRLIIISSCGWIGGSTIGKSFVTTADGMHPMSTMWLGAASFDNRVPIHEFGHGFGVEHANFITCGQQSIAETGCTKTIYGDNYSIMGSGRGQMSAAHRDYIGWLNIGNVSTVTSGGRYILEPLENSSGNLKALKIQRGMNDYLYLEYRQPLGLDAVFGGPEVNVFQGGLLNVLGLPNETLLLDATPPAAYWDSSTPSLPVGSQFRDPATGATVRVATRTSEALTVDVTIGKTDFTPPTLTIPAPTDQAIVAGIITLTAETDDASGIDKVEFYIAGVNEPFATDTSAPYAATIDSTTLPNGNNSFLVKAYDKSGQAYGVTNNSTGRFRTVIVSNNSDVDTIAPGVSLTTPVNGAVVTGVVAFGANASDNLGVVRVEFYVNNGLLASDNTSPYEVSWNTSELTQGSSHILNARAYDEAGNVGTSQEASVLISAPTPAPSPTLLPTPTPTFLPTPTPIRVPTPTPTAIPTPTSIPTPTPTRVPTPTPTPTPKPDTSPPFVSITSPENGSIVARRNVISIKANASDASGISKVEFYINGGLLCSTAASPYSCSWTVPNQSSVKYTLTAKAYDKYNNTSTSAIAVTSSSCFLFCF